MSKSSFEKIPDKDFIRRFKDLEQRVADLTSNGRALRPYFGGRLQADIDGGTLDNSPKDTYRLEIRLYHRFNQRFPNIQPFYDWWGQERDSSTLYASTDAGIFTQNKRFPTLELDASGGAASQSSGFFADLPANGSMLFEEGVVDAVDPNNPNTEFMVWGQEVTWVSGSVIVIPQTLFIIALITYFAQELPTIRALPSNPGGGGGGSVIFERLDFFI